MRSLMKSKWYKHHYRDEIKEVREVFCKSFKRFRIEIVVYKGAIIGTAIITVEELSLNRSLSFLLSVPQKIVSEIKAALI